MKARKSILLLALLSFLLTFLLFFRAEKEDSASSEAEEGGAWGAFEWWYAQRAAPYDMIPAQSFQRAASYARSALKREQAREIARSSGHAEVAALLE